MKKQCVQLVVVLSFLPAIACSQNASRDLLENLAQQQRRNRIAVGWVDDQKLNVILFSATKPEIRSYTLPSSAQKNPLASNEAHSGEQIDGIDASWSPDRKWVTYRNRENKFVLADASGKVQRVLLDGKPVVTPLRWSPDGEFLMYVKKGGIWEATNPLKCLDDVKDVMVYRVHDGQQGRIYQLCEGFPYWELQWLKVPANLPL